ncbi:MAG: phosphoenolpyruvate--protein phosphotransferase [Planctomycetota bacterium]
MYHGIAVSPGVVVAPAYCLDEVIGRAQSSNLTRGDLSSELARFESACDDAAKDLGSLIEKVSFEIGERESAIFRAHLFMLRDRAFISKVTALIIDRGLDAASALRQAMHEYEALFSEIQDEYLRERIVDLRDVVSRIQSHLSTDAVAKVVDFDDPVILVARELYPSQTVSFGKVKIVGIVTERGGSTSHAAIIARSMGIPAVSGISDILQVVKTGDHLALDGREGLVIVNPGPEAEAAYRKLEREFFDLKDYLIENRDQSAITTDGVPIDLMANINNVTDAKAAGEVGAKGIGLFRTEYLFMTHPSIPDEEEQFQAYRQIVEASPNQNLTIRTLDLGGDKTVPYLASHREANPFMGWRSIRLSLAHPDFFRRQIRAILRAGAVGNVRLMFPMISTVEELRRANRFVWQAIEELERAGIPYGENVHRGMMLEVPAAAICIDQLLKHTDFVSIGTNDLIQYLMAADRDNPRVAHLCEPLSPAVLRLIRQTVEACDANGVPLSVCGEMAGRPRCVLALLALGVKSFSMSPAFVPIIKELVHSVKANDIHALLPQLLRRRSGDQIRKFLDGVLREVNPRLAMLDLI